MRTGTGNDSLMSSHGLEPRPLWPSRRKRERRSGGQQGMSGAKRGRRFCLLVDLIDTRRFWTLVPWLVCHGLEVGRSPRCPPGNLELGAFSPLDWSRSRVGGGRPRMRRLICGLKSALSKGQPPPGSKPPSLAPSWSRGWVVILIRRPPAEQARQVSVQQVYWFERG